jgi:hypothetical protein
MNYELICKAVLIAFAAAGAFALLRGRPDWLLWQLLAGMNLGGFNWYVGTLIEPAKITMAIGLVYLALHSSKWASRVTATGNSIIYGCFVLVGVSVGMAFLIPVPNIPVQSSGFQSLALRPLVQAYTYCSVLASSLLVLSALTNKRKIVLFCDVYIGCALFSSVVAVVQFAMLQSGRGFMPILRWNAEHSEMAAFSANETLVTRLYAFAGEPKHLAAFLLPAVFMVLTSLVVEGWRPWWARWWVLAVVSFAFLFTFSTAALISFAVGFVFLMRVVGHGGVGKLVSLGAISFLVCALALAVDHELASRSRIGHIKTRPSLGEVIYERAVGRVSEQGENISEYSSLKYIFNQKPVGLLAGLGPGMYVFHLDKTWEKGIEPVVSGWISMLLDLGIAGTGLFLLWLYGVWRQSLDWVTASRGLSEMSPVIIVCLAGFVGAIFVNAGILANLHICILAGVLEAARPQVLARSADSGEKPTSPAMTSEAVPLSPASRGRRVRSSLPRANRRYR